MKARERGKRMNESEGDGRKERRNQFPSCSTNLLIYLTRYIQKSPLVTCCLLLMLSVLLSSFPFYPSLFSFLTSFSHSLHPHPLSFLSRLPTKEKDLSSGRSSLLSFSLSPLSPNLFRPVRPIFQTMRERKEREKEEVCE